MEKRRNGRNSINCEKCGSEMKSVFSDMERTYVIMSCSSCQNQQKQMLKG